MDLVSLSFYFYDSLWRGRSIVLESEGLFCEGGSWLNLRGMKQQTAGDYHI